MPRTFVLENVEGFQWGPADKKSPLDVLKDRLSACNYELGTFPLNLSAWAHCSRPRTAACLT
eukprot:11992363-Alexandrium_andersonii.AAC.1